MFESLVNNRYLSVPIGWLNQNLQVQRMRSKIAVRQFKLVRPNFQELITYEWVNQIKPQRGTQLRKRHLGEYQWKRNKTDTAFVNRVRYQYIRWMNIVYDSSYRSKIRFNRQRVALIGEHRSKKCSKLAITRQWTSNNLSLKLTNASRKCLHSFLNIWSGIILICLKNNSFSVLQSEAKRNPCNYLMSNQTSLRNSSKVWNLCYLCISFLIVIQQ